jgi:hypothetical protein
VLDEPTAVLTAQETAELMAVLQELKADGTSIVFISHKLPEVLAVADRVTVLRRGRNVGTVDTADADEAMLARMMVDRDVVMRDGPMLLRTGRDQQRLPVGRRDVEHELDPKAPHRVDDRVDLRVVLPRLELHDPGLRQPEPLGQRPLAQLVLCPISQKGRRELTSGGQPLPIRPEAGVGKLLFRDQGVEVLSSRRHR